MSGVEGKKESGPEDKQGRKDARSLSAVGLAPRQRAVRYGYCSMRSFQKEMQWHKRHSIRKKYKRLPMACQWNRLDAALGMIEVCGI